MSHFVKIKTVFFDLDGTLVDTERTAAEVILQCFAEWEMTLAPEDAQFVTGRTWLSAFDFLFKKYALPISQDQAAEQILERYRNALNHHLCVVPGSVETVQSLCREFPLGLVSGSGKREILWVLDRLGIQKCFKVILGAEDYPRSKPAPDGYLSALQILKSEAQSTLVFEDSMAGIASARAAGLWVVAVYGTNHFEQNLTQAHFTVRDLTGITPQWIAGLKFPKAD